MSDGSKKETLRRLKGEGSFELLASGMWSCYTKRNGKKLRGAPAATRIEASRNLQKRLEAERKGARQASAQSFTMLARKWVSSASLSPTTRDTYGWWLDDLENDEIGRKPVRKITQDDLDSWLLRARVRWANSTVRNRCRFVNQILALAGSDLEVAVPPKKQHSRRPLSPGERKILDALEPPEEWMLMALKVLRMVGGTRRSEAFGLRHEDRDGDGIWINRVVLLSKGKLVVRAKAKTAKSKRWVPIPAALRDSIGNGRTGFVIGGGKDPMNPKLLSDWLYRVKVASGLRNVPYFGTHAIRRTCGMQMLEAGVDLITTAEILGHDPQMLAGEYARSREDLKLDAVDKAFGSA